MIKSDKAPLFAVIDIGSGQVGLKIAQLSLQGGNLTLLENVTKTIPLGRDTFSTGRISPNMLDQLCQALNGFRQLMREYKVRRYRAVATSAFREARNREYILEQIKVRTHLNVDILTRSQERYYMQLSVRRNIEGFDKLRKEGLLVLNVGAGTLQLSGYGKSGLVYNQSFKLGSLRVRQLLSSVEDNSLQFPKVLEEYVLTHISSQEYPYTNFAATGSVIEALKSYGILKDNNKKEDFDKNYDRLIYMPTQAMTSRLRMDHEHARTVVPTLILLHTFWSRLKAKSLLCPQCSMTGGLLLEIAGNLSGETDASFEEEILSGARLMAGAYTKDEKHVEDVLDKALLLFDKLSKSHGLTSRGRLLLQLAVLFHETGKAISMSEYEEYSAMLTASSDIVGLTADEEKMLELLVRYHEGAEPGDNDDVYMSLSHKNRMLVSKLTAILQLACAMDASHRQKLMDPQIKISEDKIRIRVVPKESFLLERWAFERHTAFFNDVFGLEPQLRLQKEESK